MRVEDDLDYRVIFQYKDHRLCYLRELSRSKIHMASNLRVARGGFGQRKVSKGKTSDLHVLSRAGHCSKAKDMNGQEHGNIYLFIYLQVGTRELTSSPEAV